MTEAHFELRLPDGSIKKRLDGSTMEFKPSAYMAIHVSSKGGPPNRLLFVRDCRNPAMLQFVGGGVEIGTETPRDAAIREVKEEIGMILPDYCTFVGQFETYEPVHLFKSNLSVYDINDLKPQLNEVSEIVVISMQELKNTQTRSRFEPQFYRAQWKMLGWYLLSRHTIQGLEFPIFKLWSEDPWDIIDALDLNQIMSEFVTS